jgi:gluconolactonase
MTWPVDGIDFRSFATGLNGPEGVVWDAHRGVLYAGGRHGELYRVDLSGSVEQIVDFGEGSFVLGLALDRRGRVYACDRGRGRLLRVDPDTFAIDSYSEGVPDRGLITPNYLVFAADGTLYLSDSGTWGSNDGVIFRIAPGGTTELWSDAISDFTNGLALAADDSALFIVESRASTVWRVPVLDNGTAGKPGKIWSRPRTVPDGLAFDSDGRLYLGLYRPDAIYRIDISTGEAELMVEDWTAQYLQAPTNIAFAGNDLSLLVTANLAGEHLAIFSGTLPAPGQALKRPEIRA